MSGPFSLRCLSPLCSPAVGAGQTQPMRVGMLRRRLDGFAVSINRPVSQLTAGGRLAQPALLGYSHNAKGQRDFISTLAFLASHEARRRMAVFPIQLTTNPHQTREPRGPSPSGGISAAKLHVPQMLLRPMGGRGVGSRGTIPCASHEARRRMAVFPIQLTRKPHQTVEPRGPLPSGGISAAKLHVPQMLLRPMGGRGCGVKGYYPLCEP